MLLNDRHKLVRHLWLPPWCRYFGDLSLLLGDCHFEQPANVLETPVLLSGNLAERAPVPGVGRQAECGKQRVRVHTMRMRDVTDPHPFLDRFVPMGSPIDGVIDKSHAEEGDGGKCEQKRTTQDQKVPTAEIRSHSCLATDFLTMESGKKNTQFGLGAVTDLLRRFGLTVLFLQQLDSARIGMKWPSRGTQALPSSGVQDLSEACPMAMLPRAYDAIAVRVGCRVMSLSLAKEFSAADGAALVGIHVAEPRFLVGLHRCLTL